jgi:hypothetical protein
MTPPNRLQDTTDTCVHNAQVHPVHATPSATGNVVDFRHTATLTTGSYRLTRRWLGRNEPVGSLINAAPHVMEAERHSSEIHMTETEGHAGDPTAGIVGTQVLSVTPIGDRKADPGRPSAPGKKCSVSTAVGAAALADGRAARQ